MNKRKRKKQMKIKRHTVYVRSDIMLGQQMTPEFWDNFAEKFNIKWKKV